MTTDPMVPLTPRPAATVMLIRDAPDSPGGIAVFLMRRHSAMEFAAGVMVFPGGDAPPIRRVEIDIKDPKNVPATADALANALQECGLTLRAAYESGVPVNEIWLTFPQNDDAPAVMSLGGYFKPLHESLRLT